MTKTRANIISNRAAIAFLSIHLTISWLALRRYHPQLIPFEIVLWIAGFLLLRRTLSASGGMPESTTEVNRVSHPV
jgi:hypothetical protein